MNSEKMVVTVTKKGQPTIPKAMRERHKIGRKTLVIDTQRGVLVKAIPDPSEERGSLKGLFGKSSKEIMSEIRAEESELEAKDSKESSR